MQGAISSKFNDNYVNFGRLISLTATFLAPLQVSSQLPQ